MTPTAEPPEAPASLPSSSKAAGSSLAWKRNPIFKFLSSVRLAVLLLSILIIGCAIGTIYESDFSAKVARAYVYEAWWFNVWLLFLGINLACAAFSRWPWKKHHTGFLITHLGIIILLCGSVIGKYGGVEGSITLFAGQPPKSHLVTDQQHLIVQDGQNVARSYPISIISRKPSPQSPWNLGTTENGWLIELVGHSYLKPSFHPRAYPTSSTPAIHLMLESPRLGQKMDHWLLANDPDHSSIDLAIASVEFKKGMPAKAPAAETVEAPKSMVEEAIVVFSKKPGEQVSQTLTGSSTNTKVALEVKDSKRIVRVQHAGAKWSFDLDQFQGKEAELGGSGLRLFFEGYWPDFEMADGKPRTRSDQPVNPAALVRVRGMQSRPLESAASSGAPSGKELKLEIFAGDDGKLRYALFAGKPEPITGELVKGQPIATGWADWKATLVEEIPKATRYTEFQPQEPPKNKKKVALPEGLKVRLSRDDETFEEWIAAGWEITIPVDQSENGATKNILLGFGQKLVPLPIGLQLEKFHVEHNEGTNNPASFKSDLFVQDASGRSGRGSCWMNHPMNFPNDWWRGWTGHTYKISQASWNPENPDQSVVQILRDPGWLFKWVGCLLICLGIYTMFYLRPYPQFQKRKKN